ncbi:MAG TPA: hypothetical protein VMU87_06125 [Stellaceae bacterium]|nr:hypothetical protein [Stellaceae bacterium]
MSATPEALFARLDALGIRHAPRRAGVKTGPRALARARAPRHVLGV